MGSVFSGTRPAPSLMGRSLNLINWFGMGMRIFFKLGAGSGIAPFRLAPFTYKINFKIKLNLKFKINLI